jgi:glyoxylase-like metal-dependent hydrolase (beta-lactamase superfamily II)
VYINKVEYEGWGNVPESEMGKAYDGRIVLFDADSDLPCGIKAVEAYGHTPGHTMYRVNDILFAGDIMHAVALQLADPDICARFDQDQEASASSRKALLEYAAEEGLKVYGAHFPEPYYLQF